MHEITDIQSQRIRYIEVMRRFVEVSDMYLSDRDMIEAVYARWKHWHEVIQRDIVDVNE